jgi:hypothetical protein
MMKHPHGSNKTKKHGAMIVAADEVKTSFTINFMFSTALNAKPQAQPWKPASTPLQAYMLKAAIDQSVRLLSTQEHSTTKNVGHISLFPCIEK